MGTLEGHTVRDVGEWVQEFSPVWSSWAARLAALQPGADDELERTRKDADVLRHLISDANQQPWEGAAYITLWEQAFSGLADVVRHSKRVAQLAQQGSGALCAVVIESVFLLRYPFSCLCQCPWEYPRSMPAAQQQRHKALWQFFLTAVPQLLLGALTAERSNKGLPEGYSRCLAQALQPGTSKALRLPSPALLKRSERSSEQASVGRLLDVLELTASEGRIDVWPDCCLFMELLWEAHPQGFLGPHNINPNAPHLLLLEEAAAKPSRAALAFRYFAGGMRTLARCLQEKDFQPGANGDPGSDGLSCMATFVTLNDHFKADLLSAAVTSDPSLLGEVCAALAAVLEQVERSICSGSLVESYLLEGILDAWTSCAAPGVQRHASLQYTLRLMAATASMARIAGALGRREQEPRPPMSSSDNALSLQEQLQGIWATADHLCRRALSCLMALKGSTAPAPSSGDTEALLAALQHALSALGDVGAAWQRFHSSSSSSVADRGTHSTDLDPRLSLARLGEAAVKSVSCILSWWRDPMWLQPLRSNHCCALASTLSLALQVQVKLARALEIKWASWGFHGPEIVVELSYCLSCTLRRTSDAFNPRPSVDNAPPGQCRSGGSCSARWPPAAPYLHIIAAVQDLLPVCKRLPAVSTAMAVGYLGRALCWLLAHQGDSAVRAGAGRLLLRCCSERDLVPGFIGELRASGEATGALGAIPLLRLIAEGLGAWDTRCWAGAEERQLSMDAASLLKQCCAVVDTAASTSFAATDAEIEGEGAQLMRTMIRSGQPHAADAVRAHVWQRRAELLLPRLSYVVRRGFQVRACTGRAHSSDGSGSSADGGHGGNSGSSNQVPVCPRVAVDNELEMVPVSCNEMAAGRACFKPSCCTVLVAEGSRLLVCRGCRAACYCSASCAQADWERHRPVCRALRHPSRRGGLTLEGR